MKMSEIMKIENHQERIQEMKKLSANLEKTIQKSKKLRVKLDI